MDTGVHGVFEKIRQGNRTALGRAMTLVESDLLPDRAKAIELLQMCEEHASHSSIRFAISGPPGAGKSSLIEALGKRAIKDDARIGVITVDPSSNISQGSILGDRLRMPELSVSPSAFIRSSPAGALLGGIGRRSLELMTLLETAGYDLIMLETVGVGQSEHLAWKLTDGFVLVVPPAGGDEIQGIKRGITELADIIVVNKNDGELKHAAAASKAQLQSAIHYLAPPRTGWEVKVLTTSALEGKGIEDLWEVLRLFRITRHENGLFEAQRRLQKEFWLTWSLGLTAQQLLMEHPVVNQRLSEAVNNASSSTSYYKIEFEIENLMRKLMDSKQQKQ